ncbi:MAG: hypothetical protein HQL20_06315 [Candidatus Omnitrophica bacterium]|nr:hypothetical protein [Candidatus Omnitrophota bacterium]
MPNGSVRFSKFIALAVLVAFFSVSLSGCASFRRKFVRQNKNKEVKEDFAPVLEPIEYKRVEVAPLEAYRSHYAMVKAYFSDAYAELAGRDPGEKRERYLIGQINAHIQGMAVLLAVDRRSEAQKMIALLDEAARELDKPSGLRRYDILKGALRKVEVLIRQKLKPDMVKEFIVAE